MLQSTPSDSSPAPSVMRSLEQNLPRHSMRIKRERREQRRRLALGLACIALLSAALLIHSGAPWWQAGLLPLGLAATLFYAAFALRHSDSVWEWRLTVIARLAPPVLLAIWAWPLRGQLPSSSLVLPFVVQPMLLLLAGLPLWRYFGAVLFNLVVIGIILLLSPASLISILASGFMVLLASALGINMAYRVQHAQQRMLVMRQRVVENAEKMAERNQKMRKLALEDPLTGLANRLHLINQLRHILKNPHSEAINSALFLIDLDFFKTVNDVHGHAAGDALLIEIANRFKALVRREDLVCRLGGDEFVILVRGLSNPAQIATVADKILATLGEPVWYQQQRLPLGGSIGIAPWLPDLRSPASWLQSADEAMYQAKTGGRNRYVIADYPHTMRSDA